MPPTAVQNTTNQAHNHEEKNQPENHLVHLAFKAIALGGCPLVVEHGLGLVARVDHDSQRPLGVPANHKDK